jgi:hypothetical protein
MTKAQPGQWKWKEKMNSGSVLGKVQLIRLSGRRDSDSEGQEQLKSKPGYQVSFFDFHLDT